MSNINDGRHGRRRSFDIRAELAATDFVQTATEAELRELWREAAKEVKEHKNFGALKLMVFAGREMERRGHLTDAKVLAFISELERIVVEEDKNER